MIAKSPSQGPRTPRSRNQIRFLDNPPAACDTPQWRVARSVRSPGRLGVEDRAFNAFSGLSTYSGSVSMTNFQRLSRPSPPVNNFGPQMRSSPTMRGSTRPFTAGASNQCLDLCHGTILATTTSLFYPSPAERLQMSNSPHPQPRPSTRPQPSPTAKSASGSMRIRRAARSCDEIRTGHHSPPSTTSHFRLNGYRETLYELGRGAESIALTTVNLIRCIHLTTKWTLT